VFLLPRLGLCSLRQTRDMKSNYEAEVGIAEGLRSSSYVYRDTMTMMLRYAMTDLMALLDVQ
jgi:hypothetical protein